MKHLIALLIISLSACQKKNNASNVNYPDAQNHALTHNSPDIESTNSQNSDTAELDVDPDTLNPEINVAVGVMIGKKYRVSSGLTGLDHPIQKDWMVLPKEIVDEENVAQANAPAAMQQWLSVAYPQANPGSSILSDFDGNGLSLFEEWALGSREENPIKCGWVTDTGNITLIDSENLDSGVTHLIEVGDGKAQWRKGVEYIDYTAMDLTGTNLFQIVKIENDVRVRTRVLKSLHAVDSGLGFLRVRLKL